MLCVCALSLLFLFLSIPYFSPYQLMVPDMADKSIQDRRARLQALRAAHHLSNADSTIGTATPTSQDDGQENANTEMKFRNYFPRDNELQKAKNTPPVIPMFEDPVATDPLQVAGAEDPIVSIAPKKPNWDLRRDVAKKLEKLERRTQRAIVGLIIEEEKRRQADAADMMEKD